MEPPARGDDWTGLGAEVLPVASALDWVVRPDCGGCVVFVGTVRDHAEGRPGVVELDYEAYAEVAERRLAEIVGAARRGWAGLGRVVALHRVGPLAVTEAAVVVAVSAPHRAEAFEAARHLIDTVKATVPIWKRETWQGGAGWGTAAQDVAEVQAVAAIRPEQSGSESRPEVERAL